MTKIIKIVLLLMFIVNVAYADKFQIKYRSGDDWFYVAYSSVRIDDGERTIFEGFTDKYGRITINLPHREYNGEVFYRREWRRIRLNIDGSERLKVIYLD